MRHGHPQYVFTFCLILGFVEGLGAVLWCVAGAGMYGSPLPGLSPRFLASVLAFLAAGPCSAFLASVLALSAPRGGAAWFLGGGLLSGLLAVPLLGTDAGVLPLALVSLPMAFAGLWLLWEAGRPAPVSEWPPPRGGGAGSALLGALLFLAGAAGAYTLFGVLAINNVTGLRGVPRAGAPFVHENEDLADGVVLLIVAAAAGLTTVARRRLHLRGEVLAGVWLALLLGGLVILLR